MQKQSLTSPVPITNSSTKFHIRQTQAYFDGIQLQTLHELCEMQDFSIIPLGFDVVTRPGEIPAQIAKIPAPLACYWLGKTELDSLAGE